MSTNVPITIVIVFIALVLIIAELNDRNRKKHKGDVPSSVLERREKMSPYIMPSNMRVKPGMDYSGNPDYSLSVPESLDDSDDNNKNR